MRIRLFFFNQQKLFSCQVSLYFAFFSQYLVVELNARCFDWMGVHHALSIVTIIMQL